MEWQVFGLIIVGTVFYCLGFISGWLTQIIIQLKRKEK